MQIVKNVILFLFFNLIIVCSQAQQRLAVDSFFNRNLTSHQRDSIQRLIAYYTHLIEADSLNQQAYFERAKLYVDLGMQHKAVKDYSRLILIDSLNPIYYYNRAICRSKYGFTLDACSDMYKASQMGLLQAQEVYQRKCALYKNQLEK
ncbi:MAG: hypothetical protein HPY79_04135 [Bacteroidales bacterium]|nr:hypothetical protein [Bacteroidales bacterium]